MTVTAPMHPFASFIHGLIGSHHPPMPPPPPAPPRPGTLAHFHATRLLQRGQEAEQGRRLLGHRTAPGGGRNRVAGF